MARDEEQTKKSANNNNLKIAHQGQQNTQMRNPFYGPALGLMSSQGQMPRMPMKGGGFGPGYDPWSSLQIHPKVAEKLKDQPAVGLFF